MEEMMGCHEIVKKVFSKDVYRQVDNFERSAKIIGLDIDKGIIWSACMACLSSLLKRNMISITEESQWKK